MAQTADPAKISFGVEMDVTGVALDVRINGVPLFGVADPASAFDMRGIHFMRLNAALLPGENEITIRHDPIAEPVMEGQWIRLRFGYREAGTFPDPFTTDTYALALSIPGEGDLPLSFETREVPYLSVVDAPELVEGGTAVRLVLDYDIDIPPVQWPTGQMVDGDAATRAAIEAEMRRAHEAFSKDAAAVEALLGPKLSKLAASLGMPLEAFLDTMYVPFLEPDYGFALQPFDASGSDLVIYGNGRLATLVPPPVTFRNETTDETIAPDLGYFRDAAGTWQIAH